MISKAVTRQRLKLLLEEYGSAALVTYFTLFALVFAGFTAAIKWGVKVESAQGGAGVLGAAYLAAKVTQPIRIAVTLVLTPFVARLLERFGFVAKREVASKSE